MSTREEGDRGHTEYIGFRCDQSIRERLDVVAEAEERSLAYLVRVFVAEGLKSYEASHRKRESSRRGLGSFEKT